MKDWALHRFDEVFDLQMGKTPDRKTPQYFGGDNVWVSIRDMDKKEIIDSNEHITDEAVMATNIRKVKKGTVIMSFKLTVGKCAIAARDLYTNEAIMAFNLKDGYDINSDFLYYYLQNYKWEGANKAVMGMTLNKATISQHKIGFPPLSEQLSIVAELDKINELLSLKKCQLSDLDNVAQSVFYGMFGDSLENEKRWALHRFDEVFDLQMGKTPDRKTPQYFGGDNVWVSIRDMSKKEIIDSNEHITDEAVMATNIRKVKKGTVIMSFKLTVGKCAIAARDLYTNEAIMAFNLKDGYDINSDFLYYYLQNYKWEGANKAVMGMTLNKATISQHKIGFPPLSEQQEFAKKIAAIEHQKQQICSTIKDLETLLASRMQYWFN